MRRFWRLWYRLFTVVPPRGKGTRENPLTLDDLGPLFTMLRRTGWVIK